AAATFTGETAGGWQQVTFAQPVVVRANTTYVASYYAPAGNYAEDDYYFLVSGAWGGQLTALANDAAGNGVDVYRSSGFPDQTYNGTNYWVDVSFQPAAITDPNTTANAGPDTTAAEGATVQFAGKATGVGLTFAWTFGDGQSASGSLIPTHAYSDNGT